MLRVANMARQDAHDFPKIADDLYIRLRAAVFSLEQPNGALRCQGGQRAEAERRNRLLGLTRRLSYFGAHECARSNGRWAMESTGSGQPDEAQQQLMIERQLAFDFYDPSLEWRRLFAETWGTFLLVLVAAGAGVVAAMSGGRVTLGMMVVAPGIVVMAIIYFMGAVSGAHLNPAVTLGGGEYNPGHGVWCAEHRYERCHRRGRVHCSGRALGSAGKRGLYESGAFAGAGCGAWQLPHDLDLRRRAVGGRPDRSGVRVDSQRQGLGCR